MDIFKIILIVSCILAIDAVKPKRKKNIKAKSSVCSIENVSKASLIGFLAVVSTLFLNKAFPIKESIIKDNPNEYAIMFDDHPYHITQDFKPQSKENMETISETDPKMKSDKWEGFNIPPIFYGNEYANILDFHPYHNIQDSKSSRKDEIAKEQDDTIKEMSMDESNFEE